MSDPLPPDVTYVPGSLAIQTGPGAGPLTDAAGDDRGEFNPSTRTVTVRLGTGATASSGGTLAIGASTSVTFRVTLNPAAGGTTVSNTGTLGYNAQTSGLVATYQTPPAQTAVAPVADLAVTKSLTPDPAAAGAPLTATMTVTNNGPNTAGSVVLTHPLPSGMTATTASSSAGSCSLPAGGSGTITCQIGALAPGAVATITISGATSPSSTVTSLTNVAQVTTSSVDPNPANNVAAATIGVTRSADLSITKTASPSTPARRSSSPSTPLLRLAPISATPVRSVQVASIR